jgi:hypothetical protein
MRSSPAFDQPQLRVNLICPVYREIDYRVII